MKSALILIMQYQKMIRSTIKLAVIVLSLSSISIGCAAPNSVAKDSIKEPELISLVSFGTINSEQEVTKLVSFLNEVENPKRFQLECDKQNIAQSCYYYASYNDLIVDDRKKSYPYYKKAFDLGSKQAGYFIGAFQINYPETFDNETRLDIDESIYYLEHDPCRQIRRHKLGRF